MLALLASIACSVALMLIFKSYQLFRVQVLHAVAVNYWVCVLTGVLFTWLGPGSAYFAEAAQGVGRWGLLSVVLGGLFIGGFYLTGVATQRVGVSISTLAGKVSLVVPVLFSLLVLGNAGARFDGWNYAGLALALPALALTAWRPESTQAKHTGSGLAVRLLPLLVFAAGGAVDTTLNLSGMRLQSEAERAVFPIASFGMAALVGTVLVGLRWWTHGEKPALRSVLGGICLGVPNYFSIYLLLLALEHFNQNGALLFPLYNMAVILLATGASVLLFAERLSWVNLCGIGLAVLAIFLISYQGILGGNM